MRAYDCGYPGCTRAYLGVFAGDTWYCDEHFEHNPDPHAMLWGGSSSVSRNIDDFLTAYGEYLEGKRTWEEIRAFPFWKADEDADALVASYLHRTAPAPRKIPLKKKEYDPGFDRPEDGSQKRYIERRKVRPWRTHTLWWVLHNAVAHPLIAFLPFTPLFRFHDWTSRRMHGL